MNSSEIALPRKADVIKKSPRNLLETCHIQQRRVDLAGAVSAMLAE